ncbi:MAG: type II toxin-antitoxin system MqsR family toxin [Bacteroidetes bacterium]|nr:type II toxin-antitoxin system MqsR family toxin [Bacteroidota bacterium]MCA6444080.1 type II toxin-antitoxin system MqsR family toxin [Bacteroidota bacterium]
MLNSKAVEHFLKEFKQKMKIWDVLFRDDRGKNAQTLADLEIRPSDRKKVLEDLKVEDYCQGPLEETLYLGNDMWVFGRVIKKKQVYIKITMGFKGASVLCISFHLAEHELNFPLK